MYGVEIRRVMLEYQLSAGTRIFPSPCRTPVPPRNDLNLSLQVCALVKHHDNAPRLCNLPLFIQSY